MRLHLGGFWRQTFSSLSVPNYRAQRTFHGGSVVFGFMTAAMGAGAVAGGLFTAARGRTGLRPMILALIGFGVAILVTAYSPTVGLAYAALLFVGWASVSFIAIGNSAIQLTAVRAARRSPPGRAQPKGRSQVMVCSSTSGNFRLAYLV